LKAEDAKDMGQTKFCDEQASKNRRDQANRKNDLDLKMAEVQNHKHAMVKFKDSLAYFDEEILRLQQEMAATKVEVTETKKQVKSETVDHNLAIRILEQSIHALKTLCGLSFRQTHSGQSASFSHRAGQCGEVVEIIGDARKKFKEQNAAAAAAVREMEDLADKSNSDAREAMNSKKSEKQTTANTLSSRKDAMFQAKDDVKTIETDIKSLVTFKDNLEQQCGPNIPDAGDKIKRLQEEIEALKNALQVLEGDAIPGGFVQEWPMKPIPAGDAKGPSALQRAAAAIGMDS